jgi:hypothetical protein
MCPVSEEEIAMSVVRWPILLTFLIPAAGLADDPDPVAVKAHNVLKAHCYKCHGEAGNVEGGMNYILDFDRLVARKKVVPGKADQSPVWKRVANGTMPPPDVHVRLGVDDKAALKAWIDAGAKPVSPAPARDFIAQTRVNDWVLADLEKIDRRSRRFQRYFTLTYLANAGLGEDELRTYRNALSKLINSLSWHPKVRNPEPIDPTGTVFRIDPAGTCGTRRSGTASSRTTPTASSTTA